MNPSIITPCMITIVCYDCRDSLHQCLDLFAALISGVTSYLSDFKGLQVEGWWGFCCACTCRYDIHVVSLKYRLDLIKHILIEHFANNKTVLLYKHGLFVCIIMPHWVCGECAVVCLYLSVCSRHICCPGAVQSLAYTGFEKEGLRKVAGVKRHPIF